MANNEHYKYVSLVNMLINQRVLYSDSAYQRP